jgi:hypothetical protein
VSKEKKPSGKVEQRQDRLAAALRANLQRRKAQARERKAVAEIPSEDDERQA